MPQRILVMGLPGSGKTTFSNHLKQHLELLNQDLKISWLNADKVRQTFNDWDFSLDGRIRQSKRMRDLADNLQSDFVICDFIAPIEQMRNEFDANFTVWIDTITAGRFQDTNHIFEPPKKFDFRIQEKNADHWAKRVARDILNQNRLR